MGLMESRMGSSADGAATGLVGGYSLEITGKDVDNLELAHPWILPGTAISITFLPGEDLETRLKAAAVVKRIGGEPIPHISARRITSVAELENFLHRLTTELGVERVFVVAGDLPAPVGPYHDALAIIESGILARHGIRQVGIAGYPEGHPDISNEVLHKALLEKAAAIDAAGQRCEIVTQFGFDAEPVLDWIAKVRGDGIMAPVRVGIPGPASVKTLLRFAARCGVGASAKVFSKYGLSITRLLSTAGPDNLLRDLKKGLDPEVHGAVKIHIYPFGGLKTAAQWAAEYVGARTSDRA